MKTSGRIPLFARIRGRSLQLTQYGRIVDEEWRRTAQIRPEVTLGPFVVMPDHFHALVEITLRDDNQDRLESGRKVCVRYPRSIGALVGGFKGSCTKRINMVRGTPGRPVWQSHYYDCMVRSHRRWMIIARYIEENPEKLLRRSGLIP